jgi:glycerol-3-phosphate acyltransferase PlsY
MVAAVLILSGYLLGSLSFAYFAGKLLKGVDLRKVGSGNLGATNTLRELGTLPGVIVLLLDASKGAIAVWLGSTFAADGQWWLVLVCGMAAIAGHNWPFYLQFKGGKGVATAAGVMLSLYLLPLLCAMVVALLIMGVTRYVSLGSMIGSMLLPLFVYLFDPQFGPDFWFATFIAALVIIRHHSNIRKLLNGSENKLSFKKKTENGV